MLHIVLPQAVRRVLPALGNELVAIVKDSSLVSIVGVQDLTQLTRLYYNANFKYLEALIMLSFIYLVLIVVFSRLVKLMENRLRQSPV